MNAKEIRWLFPAAMAAVLVMGFAAGPVNFGVSEVWNNGHYSFGGGTAPWALAFSLVIIAFYLLLMYSVPAVIGEPMPGVFRRFVAFWLDFILAMMVVGPVLGILPMLTEWKRTGVFQWNFERTTRAPGDVLLAMIGVTLAFAALALYYAVPLVRRKPSPGACVLGYQVVPEEGTTLHLHTALLRTLLGFVAVCAWWLTPFVARDRKKGQLWLDKVFRTRAVRLT
jgi:uncharacterized RDD family membrane protein YckC